MAAVTSAVILEPRKIKALTVSNVSPSICHEVMGLDAMILVFWMLSFKPTFSLSSFTLIKRLFSSSSLSAIRVVSSVYLRLLIFLPAILIWGSVVKNLPVNAGDAGDTRLIPGSGRSLGEGNGSPFQYSCLENSMDRVAWWATVHGVTKTQTQLSDSACKKIVILHYNYFIIALIMWYIWEVRFEVSSILRFFF